MRFTTRTQAATTLLGSTLVFAMPRRHELDSFEHLLQERSPQFDSDITVVYGSASPATGPSIPQSTNPVVNQGVDTQTANVDAAPSNSPSQTQNSPATSTPNAQPHDTVTSDSPIHSTSGSNTPLGSQITHASNVIGSADQFTSSTSSLPQGSLAPEPASGRGGLSGRGALIGVVVGGLLLGCLLLALGLWLCYRRRGSGSGSSTPRYTIPVTDDEKPHLLPAFLRNGFKKSSWKKSHTRVRSSLSFASPMIDDEPRMTEKTPTTQTPLAPHLGGTSAVRDTWATFTSSEGSASVYPQTPVGTTRLSGIIMETVVETDAQSDPHAPTMISRQPPDYLGLRRSDTESKPFQHPDLTPIRTNRLSTFHEEDESATPTTTSSGGLTYGSIGHGSDKRYTKSSDRVHQLPPVPVYHNDSNPFLSGHNSALLATRPKFNPTHSNGSGTMSIDRESGDTIRITNPFLDDEDASSYGHGIVESEGDRQSMLSTTSSAFAYPSSAGCIPKPTPSPNPDAPINRPRSSLISDASSDYPYPLGYAMDADGNVANPFLRISEILEEVDGRMRWPSPPLLNRSESRNI